MYVRTFVWMDKARRALKLFNLTVSQCMYCLVRLLRALIASTRSIQHSSNRYRSNYILLGLEWVLTLPFSGWRNGSRWTFYPAPQLMNSRQTCSHSSGRWSRVIFPPPWLSSLYPRWSAVDNTSLTFDVIWLEWSSLTDWIPYSRYPDISSHLEELDFLPLPHPSFASPSPSPPPLVLSFSEQGFWFINTSIQVIVCLLGIYRNLEDGWSHGSI